MASVFLSYDRDDTAKAAEIAAALENASHSVWWDQRIRGGAQYSKEIEQALDQADAVIVLWSKSSVESAWVRDEAAEGRDRGKLIPVLIDSSKAPIGFRQFQTIDLPRAGRARSAALDKLLRAVEDLAASANAVPVQLDKVAPLYNKSRTAAIVGGSAAALITAGALLVLDSPFAPSATDEISAAVAPLDATSQSKALSDDLVAKLGQLSTRGGASIRLLGADHRSKAAFVFRAGGSSHAGQFSANLLLLDGRTSSLLWSAQFQRPSTAIGDLRQEMGYTASQVLGCASDAYGSRELGSKLNLLKSYLDSCAAAAKTDAPDPLAQAAQFRRIVNAAPRFPGAWAQLLLAEATGASDSARRAQLKADIATARKLQPDMPEAYFGEVALLPFEAYGARLNLLEQGLRRNPDSPLLLAARSEQLLAVGRLHDAVEDARRAAELDPASPDLRNGYIYALAHSGRVQAALDEIGKAERFWPGSTGIARTKYIVNSRYGDPAKALAYVESSAYEGDVEGTRIYLEARMNPTPANIDRAIASTRDFYRNVPRGPQAAQAAASMMQILGMFGRQKELVDLVLSMPPSDFALTEDVLFRPTMRILWLDPHSLVLAKRLGLLGYWSKSGQWPDFCSQPGFPYDCKEEATKVGR